MNAYVLPLLINNRRETSSQLLPGGWNDGKQYLVEARHNWQFPLLSLTHETVLRPLTEGATDLPLHTLQHACTLTPAAVQLRLFSAPVQPVATPETQAPAAPLTYEDLEAYRVQKTKKETAPRQAFQPTRQSVGLWQDKISIWLIQDDGGGLHLTASAEEDLTAFCNTEAANIPVRIQLEVNGETYHCDTQLSLAAPEQLLGIALDFGSESSQMTVKRSTGGPVLQNKKPGSENLFQNLLAFHKVSGWLPPSGTHEIYYQEEPGTNFYKSIFFLKGDLTGHYEDVSRELFIKNRKDNLKMLVNTHDGFTTLSQQQFHQLPNLKLTHKYNELFSKIKFSITKQGYPIPISLGDVKGKVYNSILKTLLESFLKKEFIQYEGATRKIRLVLLVPNIYDFGDVKATQLLLHEIFQDLATHEYSGRLLAWEVLTISESDASLLGYVNKNPDALGSNRDYVIVDCGKGTTDLSVMRTGGCDGFTMQPVFRNGFAGAGNLITYAVFETLLHYLRASTADDAAARAFIRNKILAVLNSNDLERKTRFYQQLERLKFSFRESSPAIRAQWSSARTGDIRFRNIATSGGDLGTLTDLLQQIENLGDFYGYIAQATGMIAEKVAGNIALIKNNQPDFQCGGVLLTGRAFLFEPLATAVHEKLKALLQIPDNRIELLRGQELKDVCVKGVFHSAIRINAEKTGFPIEVYFGGAAQPAAEKEPAAPKKQRGWQERFFQAMFNDLNQLQQAEAVIISDKALGLSRLLKSQILIGANRYKLVPPPDYSLMRHAAATADLIFTPDGYLARQMEADRVVRTFPLEEIFDAEVMEHQMVIPSLFPSVADEEYLDALTRTDIVKLPIIPDPPTSTPTPTSPATPAAQPASSGNSSNKNGPIYF